MMKIIPITGHSGKNLIRYGIRAVYPYRRNCADERGAYYQEHLDANIALITAQVENHPETQFKIFFPAYSMLYWDNLYRTGDLEAYLYNMEQAIGTLLTYENVEIYYFQDETEIITNLEHYMDTLHFSPEINHYMAEEIIAGNQQLTVDNYKETINGMRELAYQIVTEYIVPYEDLIKVDYMQAE